VWTLSVELFASYWIFSLAFVVICYRGRFWIYGLIFMFLFVPRITDAYHYTNYGFDSKFHVKHDQFFDKAIRESLPTFFIGVMFCDLEHDQKVRRLDSLRELPWYVKIPLNTALIVIFCIYASVAEDSEDHYRHQDMRTYDIMVTGDYTIGFGVCMHIAALSIFLLALISQWFQWILASPPF
jgi:peptidoglycan/LPS O-acetylase OafA/YrhL